jgi:anti-sigma factor RsiW
MSRHPTELISAYADGELTGDDEMLVRTHLAECSECARDLALIKSIGEAMMHSGRSTRVERSMWAAVHQRIVQPVGWLLFVAGVTVWVALALFEWFSRGALTLGWLATTAIIIGLALIAVGVIYQQYTEWRDTPYKDVDR